MSPVNQEVTVIVEDVAVFDNFVFDTDVKDRSVTIAVEEARVIVIDELSDIPVEISGDYVDFEGEEIPGLFRGIIKRPFIFIKSVLGKKQTYASLSSTITANFVTQGGGVYAPSGSYGGSLYGSADTYGGGEIGSIDTYGSDPYGADAYGDIIVQFSSLVESFTFGASTSGTIISKSTPIAELSLASHATPSSRTNHAIIVRARTTAGGGILRAELYEGTTKRSSTLSTPALTNTLTTYTLSITNAEAAAITNYNNLSIKLWGHDGQALGLVFQVSELSLQLPSS